MKLTKVIAEKKDGEVVHTVPLGTTLRDAAREMARLKTGALLVTTPGQTDELRYPGMFAATDLLRAIGVNNACLDTAKVEEFMTRRLIVASINDDVEYVMNVMLRHEITHLPIIKNKRICTVVSRSDILNALNVEKDIELQWLSDYTGAPGGNRNSVY